MLRLTGLLCVALFATLMMADPSDVATGPAPADDGSVKTALTGFWDGFEVQQTVKSPLKKWEPPVEPVPVAVTEVVSPRPAASQPVAANIWKVSASKVNVRSGPSKTDGVVGTLARAEQVLIIGDATGEWVEVRVEGDGVSGFVARRFLEPVSN